MRTDWESLGIEDVVDMDSEVSDTKTRFTRRITQFCQECCDIKQGEPKTVQRKKILSTAVDVAIGLSFCYAFQYIIHNPTCNALFRCGCTWEWAGGWKDCNVFSTGPKCPWCISRANVSWTTDYLIHALMIVTYFYFLNKRRYYYWPMRFAMPVVIYFLGAVIVGFFFVMFSDNYPSFII